MSLAVTSGGEIVAAAGAATGMIGIVVASSTLLRRQADRSEAGYRRAIRGDVIGWSGSDPAPRDGEETTERTNSYESSQQRLALLPIDYHAQVLAQSRQSFFLSLAAAVAGFVVIALGVGLASTGDVSSTITTMSGGVIAEAVAALFFTQSQRARTVMANQLEGFRQSEETRRQATDRMNLIKMVADEKVRDELIKQTVLVLARSAQNADGVSPP